MRIAQINVVSSLSTGRIAVTLCRLCEKKGHQALLCHARDCAPPDIFSYRIGNKFDHYVHVLLSRLTDRTGFFSKGATKKLIRQLEKYKPDLIHLHNLHGYYLHLPTLFAYLKKSNLPIVWTLHDCWAFTGHCAYYTMAKDAPPPDGTRRRRAQSTVGCERWKTGCGHCVLHRTYPASWFIDQSAKNWQQKRALFSDLPYMVITAPSNWMHDEIKQSFLGKYPVFAMPNGVDLDKIQPCDNAEYLHDIARYYKLDTTGGKKIVLSAAAVWDERKGLDDLIDLSEALGDEYCVVAVGLDEYQIASLPKNGVLGLKRTDNVKDLCALYTVSDVYVSVSHEETMGMTLVEALACGTQVICYNATAMPEIVTDSTGMTVETGNIEQMAAAVRQLCQHPKSAGACRARAAEYDADKRFSAYIQLYENMYRHSPAYLNALKKADMQQKKHSADGE